MQGSWKGGASETKSTQDSGTILIKGILLTKSGNNLGLKMMDIYFNFDQTLEFEGFQEKVNCIRKKILWRVKRGPKHNGSPLYLPVHNQAGIWHQ